ncbi:MAG: hypothetical protein AMXMBFR34_46060 [Myxococcaceae bacterium]
MSQGYRALGFLAATAALVLAVGVLGPRLLGLAAGPEAELVTRLKKLEKNGLELEVPGAGTLHAAQVSFQRISVRLDADGQGATITSTLDLTGNLKRPGAVARTTVSSLGLERARYLLRDGQWRAQSTDAPRLLAILTALEQRRELLESPRLPPDAGLDALEQLTRRAYTSLAWYIRSEREDVTVAEDYRLTGDTPQRPVDDKGTRRLSLVEDSAGLFTFPGGIM